MRDDEGVEDESRGTGAGAVTATETVSSAAPGANVAASSSSATIISGGASRASTAVVDEMKTIRTLKRPREDTHAGDDHRYCGAGGAASTCSVASGGGA